MFKSLCTSAESVEYKRQELPTVPLCAQNLPPAKPRTTRYSGSMGAAWEGRPRMEVAKSLLAKMVDSLNTYTWN